MKAVHSLAVGCGLALLPSIASAALRVVLPEGNAIGSFFLPGLNTYDVFLTGTDAEDEKLFAYGMGLQISRIGPGPLGLTVASPPVEQPPDFVFQSAQWHVASFDADSVEFDVENTGELVDIPEGQEVRVARLRLLFDRSVNVGLWQYQISIIPVRTGFGSADPSRPDPILDVDLSDTGLIMTVPEPSSLALPALALLAVRRRRPSPTRGE